MKDFKYNVGDLVYINSKNIITEGIIEKRQVYEQRGKLENFYSISTKESYRFYSEPLLFIILI